MFYCVQSQDISLIQFRPAMWWEELTRTTQPRDNPVTTTRKLLKGLPTCTAGVCQHAGLKATANSDLLYTCINIF